MADKVGTYSHNVCVDGQVCVDLNTHISTQQERESNSNSNDGDDDDDKACMHVFRSCKRKYFSGGTATAVVCMFCIR